MIVQVRQPQGHPTRFVEVQGFADNGTDHDNACRVAFRFVYKRQEKDYNELMHNTQIMEIQTVTPEVAAVMLTHINS